VIDRRGFEFVVKASFFVVKYTLRDIKLHFIGVLCISWIAVYFIQKKSPITIDGTFSREHYMKMKKLLYHILIKGLHFKYRVIDRLPENIVVYTHRNVVRI